LVSAIHPGHPRPNLFIMKGVKNRVTRWYVVLRTRNS
jgi:hypothetical protein